MDVDSPKPDPNIGKAAQANAEIAGRMQDLAEKQFSQQSALFDEYSPLLKDLLSKSVVAQDKATAQSDAAWADYNATWRPVEQKLAADSLAWASPGRQEQEANRAGAGVADAFGNAREETRRALVASGADPTTIASLEAAGRLEEAKATAGAKDAARRDVEKTGLAYLDNAAKFGRNMPSTGIATAQLAGQSGQQAQGGYSGLAAASAMPGQAAGNLYSGAVNANNAAGNLYLGQFDAQQRAANTKAGIFGDILGAGLQAAGMFLSSKRLKDVGNEIDGGLAVLSIEKSPSVRWTYKPGMGDGSTKERMGPTAESLRDATGGLVSDGTKVDAISMLGLHHAAIGNTAQRLRKIEKQLGLADAEA